MLRRYLAAANSGTVSQEECNRLKSYAEDTLPEYNSPTIYDACHYDLVRCLFPFVMYLVSRHPDTPTTADLSGAGDVERMKQINKCIAMVWHVTVICV